MVIGILASVPSGLIIIPELVYVRDIYEESYARSNTMFKLTYQAFILFGICMSYIITRFLLWKKRADSAGVRRNRAGTAFMDVRLFWNERVLLVRKCFRSVRVPRTRCDSVSGKCLSEDAGAIRWLDETIEGQSVVLEANGDSYSDYERVSAMTGLPTVLGWYVHEWLWRGIPQT